MAEPIKKHEPKPDPKIEALEAEIARIKEIMRKNGWSMQ